MGGQDSRGGAGPGGAANNPEGGLALSRGVASRLEQQSGLQDMLTDELVGMAGSLKQGALSLQEAVARRGAVVEAADAAMEASVAAAKDSAARSRQTLRRGRGSFCLTCLILLAVGCILAGMMVYIRVTSLMGYRAGASRLSFAQAPWARQAPAQAGAPARGSRDGEL